MNIPPTIILIQAELGITADGQAGPQTWKAIARRILPRKGRSFWDRF